MAYVDGKRRAILVYVRNAIRDVGFFKEVGLRSPEYPKADQLPAAYVALGVEQLKPLTAEEKESVFPVIVILIVRTSESRAMDLELIKADAADAAEKGINSLYTNSDFMDLVVRLDVNPIDYGPLSLRTYGLDMDVSPPFGAVRIDVDVTFDYVAF